MHRGRVALAAGVLTAAFALVLIAGATAAGNGKGLSKEDKAALAQARVDGQSNVSVLIASKPGANASVVSALEGMGGAIRYRDDQLDYIRVRIAADKVDAVSKLEGVQAANVDTIIPLDDPKPETDGPNVDPPGAGTPNENAYMPTRDIGAPQFVAAHPTWDGRGVKIGILDTGIDLLAPELQTAKTQAGASVKKIVDWVTYTDPVDDGDPTWINMADQVSGASFTYKGVTYTAPAAGTHRIGLFNERNPNLGGELGNDVNRDGNPAGSSGIFAVLWDTTSNKVYVDANQNNSFADQAGMTDYKSNFDVGTFGSDNPATAVRETVPFVVQTDGQNKFVNIGIVSGAHGTHVAGIAAGKNFFGGTYDGAAPEAQIVAIRVCLFVAGCTAHALVEGMIFAEKQASVDVINMSIGGLPALNDGNNTRAILYNRLIGQYKAQMFISAGNSYAGTNTVGDPSVATDVMSVGAYVTGASYAANYGATVAKADGLFPFSSRGPREDGGFKPQIVAPGSAVSTIPAWQNPAGQCIAYSCPPGYAMFNGTSMAAPQATGGAALLISAAKQTGAQWNPNQLRQAINSSARFLSGYGAHEQGNGLVRLAEAWDLLKTNIKTVDITSSAPVKTVISNFLATPDKGPGIYEREGWSPGESGSRTITFTRTSGGGGATSYNLSWVGDGAFKSAGSISLARNVPTNLTVNITALAAGVHSAILKVDDPSTAGVDYEVMNTIIVAEEFNAANNFTVTKNSQADRADVNQSFYFFVPANTPALKVDLTNGTTSRLRMLRYHPYGVGIGDDALGFQTGGATVSKSVANPLAGVWQVVVEASRTSPADPATFTLSVSILGADIDPTSWTVDPTTIGTPYSQPFTFTNRFGAFTGNAVGTALGSAFSARPTIAAAGPQQVYEIQVPAGSTSVSAQIGNASDNAADLDLFLFDCTNTAAPCVLRARSTSGSSEEFVSVANPAAGLWKVLVDPFAVPAGTTQYDYVDVFANPAFGSVSVADVSALHPSGSSWTATATATANAAPASGRFLRGFVQVRSGSTVLGQAQVSLKNVH